MKPPYAVPTVVTQLFRRDHELRPGDGVVVVQDGFRHFGTVVSADEWGATVEFPGGEATMPVVWEEGE